MRVANVCSRGAVLVAVDLPLAVGPTIADDRTEVEAAPE